MSEQTRRAETVEEGAYSVWESIKHRPDAAECLASWLHNDPPLDGLAVGWMFEYLDDESHTWEWIGEPHAITIEDRDLKLAAYELEYDEVRAIPLIRGKP